MQAKNNPYNLIRALTASALVALYAAPQPLVAQISDHLVSPTELQKAAVNASQQHQQNLDTLKAFFGSDKARQAMQQAKVNPDQVSKAISSLSDDELAQFASRARKAQAEFAAGSMSDRDLIILLVAIAVLILIIVAVR